MGGGSRWVGLVGAGERRIPNSSVIPPSYLSTKPQFMHQYLPPYVAVQIKCFEFMRSAEKYPPLVPAQ